MPPSRSGKSLGISVKSSPRTLQILEYIDAKQRAVTIAELSASLAFLQSSTSTLVQSMINAGYLVVDHDGRRILPSSRVAALGSWVEPSVSRADIRSLMVAVGERTNQTILLGVPSDLCVRYIDVIPGRHAMGLDIPVGALGIGGLSELISRDARQILSIVRDAARQLGISLKLRGDATQSSESKTTTGLPQ